MHDFLIFLGVGLLAQIVDGKARPLYTYSDKAETREKSAS